MSWTRRDFLVASGAAALVPLGCSSEDDSGDEEDGATEDVAEGEGPVDSVIVDADVPTSAAIFAVVNEIFDQGVRRPGYPADEWAEEWCRERFEELGLENVRLEPVPVTRWEPEDWSLKVTVGDEDPVELECLPVPYGTPAEELDLELARFDPDAPEGVAGKASLYQVSMLELPADSFLTGGSAPEDLSRRSVDLDGTLGEPHHLPFGGDLGEVIEPSVDAGAEAFIGWLGNYPTESRDYFVPYDGVTRPIPGVWISDTDGTWLDEQLNGSDRVRVGLTIESSSREVRSNNVVGELPGADDEVVMIGSHHDGPWASAVEDASGMSLVLAQAEYWATQPAERRPHHLVFVLQGGHMFGGAGLKRYIEDHRDELDNVVLQIHLEHVALECEIGDDGSVEPTSRPVPRWFFTSRIPDLEEQVYAALEAEEVDRSMLLAPDAIGEQPPTDGAFYYNEGVPIVHCLAAPFYLFDKMDTPDKIDQDSLVPLTRATIRIVESTRGISAADMRSADLAPFSGSGEETD
jgi:hypothetical protein